MKHRKYITQTGIFFLLIVTLFACTEKKNQEDDQSEGELFMVVEELPSIDGAIDAFYDYIRNDIRYPLEARQNGVEGQVEIKFIIERDGTISGAEVVNGIGAGCDEEALRVIQNAPLFKPGNQRGKSVRVQMTIPIQFKLDEEKTNEDGSPQGMIIVEKAEITGGMLNVEASYADGEWSGIVYSPEGDVLPGANIIVAGTTSGTVADLDGSFKIKTEKSNEVVVSFVGYKTVKLEEKE